MSGARTRHRRGVVVLTALALGLLLSSMPPPARTQGGLGITPVNLKYVGLGAADQQSGVAFQHSAPSAARLSIKDLGTLGGLFFSGASGINKRGQIVGESETASGASHAFLWEDGRMTDLGTLSGDYSGATGINDRGQITGYSASPSEYLHAFLWEDGRMTDLGTLGGSSSAATGINDRGQIVGDSQTASGPVHAFLWEDGRMRDLGTLGGPVSVAKGINDRGQIVGSSETASEELRAVLWTR